MLLCNIFANMVSWFVLLGVFIHFCLGLNFPPYIRQCKRDEDVSKCFLENIDRMRPHIINGIPELYIPPLNPLTLTEIRIENNRYTFGAREFFLHGLETYEPTDLKLDLENAKMSMDVHFPFLWCYGNYTMSGKILLLELNGHGEAFGNLTDLRGVLTFNGVKEVKNGKHYINFDKFHMTMKFGAPNWLYFNNLFGDREDVTKGLMDIINQDTTFLEALSPFIEAVAGTVFKRTLQMIFSNNAIEDLFL